jgi:hypothetical protein
VVLISGFTHPVNEFQTPYRVINYHVCNSCGNDQLLRFDRGDFMRCPRHQNTPRQFECSRLITSEQVKDTTRRIPGFGRPASSPEPHAEDTATSHLYYRPPPDGVTLSKVRKT